MSFDREEAIEEYVNHYLLLSPNLDKKTIDQIRSIAKMYPEEALKSAIRNHSWYEENIYSLFTDEQKEILSKKYKTCIL